MQGMLAAAVSAKAFYRNTWQLGVRTDIHKADLEKMQQQLTDAQATIKSSEAASQKVLLPQCTKFHDGSLDHKTINAAHIAELHPKVPELMTFIVCQHISAVHTLGFASFFCLHHKSMHALMHLLLPCLPRHAVSKHNHCLAALLSLTEQGACGAGRCCS